MQLTVTEPLFKLRLEPLAVTICYSLLDEAISKEVERHCAAFGVQPARFLLPPAAPVQPSSVPATVLSHVLLPLLARVHHLARSHSGSPTILKLACWVCGANCQMWRGKQPGGEPNQSEHYEEYCQVNCLIFA